MEENTEKRSGLDSLFRKIQALKDRCYGHSGAGADSGPGTDGCLANGHACCWRSAGVAKTLLAVWWHA